MMNAVCALGLLLAGAPTHLDMRVVLAPIRYELNVEIDYTADRLQASVEISVENRTRHPARQASFLLYRLLHVRSARNGRGAPLAFTQSVVPFEDDGKLQANQVVVTLPAALPPGAHTTVRLDYDGYLLGYAETGSRYIQDRIDKAFTILREDSYAYPMPGYPSHALMRQNVTAWEFTYSASITVPKDMTVVNGGRLEGTDPKGDQVTFRYSSLKPSWRMDFAIAKYASVSSPAVRVFYLPGDQDGAAGVAQAAEKSLELYTGWFGPLPGSSALTFIEIPDGWGSQADVTTIIQTAAAFRDVKQHREVYHEVSHLWNVSDTDRPSPRWNEGLATFLEFLVDQELSGQPRVDARANRSIDWLRTQLPSHPEWRTLPLVDYGQKDLTYLSYTVGAMFFDLLYRLVGRESFNRIIREYNTRFAAGGSTNDLLDVVRKSGRAGLSQLVADWMTTPGWVDRVEHMADIHDLEAYYRSGANK